MLLALNEGRGDGRNARSNCQFRRRTPGALVTGQTLPPGTVFDLNFDFPAHSFADGRPYPMTVFGGEPLMVTFEKVRDLPDERS